jgi:hypothetical protein
MLPLQEWARVRARTNCNLRRSAWYRVLRLPAFCPSQESLRQRVARRPHRVGYGAATWVVLSVCVVGRGLSAQAPVTGAGVSQGTPDCLQGLPMMRQALGQLQQQGASDPRLQRALGEVSQALAQYEQYSPQVQQVLNQAEQTLKGIPDRVCSGGHCVDLSGHKSQAYGALHNARDEWSRVGDQIRQQQRQAQSQVQRVQGQFDQMQARMQQQMEQRMWQQQQDRMADRCRQQRAQLARQAPGPGQPPSGQWAPPRLRPIECQRTSSGACFGRLDFSTARRPLHLPPGYQPPAWPPPNRRARFSLRPEPAQPPPGCSGGVAFMGGCVVTRIVEGSEGVQSWFDQEVTEFRQRAGTEWLNTSNQAAARVKPLRDELQAGWARCGNDNACLARESAAAAQRAGEEAQRVQRQTPVGQSSQTLKALQTLAKSAQGAACVFDQSQCRP